jgi:hypothetical protein
VLVGRVHFDRVRCLAAVGKQRVPVARLRARREPVAERRVVCGLGLVGTRPEAVREQPAQVVRDAAAADDEDAVPRQRPDRLAERELRRRRRIGNEGERDDRNVGVGVDEAQRRPGAVVEAALVDALCVDAGALQQREQAGGEGGVAGRVVAQRPQLRIEAAEVVDRLVPRRGEDDGSARRGMRRDGDDRLRPAERGVDRRAEPLHEGAGGAGLERDHRRAVRDEERGQGGAVHASLEHRRRGRGFNPLARSVRNSGNFRAR